MKALIAGLALAVCVGVSTRAQQQDFSQVQIKTTKLAGNFYTLEGSGGTIGVLPGPDGVFMVDTQFAPLSDKIVAAIKQISDGRIRYLVNTHVHPDHTGGNENIGKQGRDDLRAREPARADAEAGGAGQRPAGRPGPGARAADGHLRRAADVSHERRGRPADSGAGRAHRRRHDGLLSERQRDHDGRLLPLDRLPEHRPRQRRHDERHAGRLRRDRRRSRARTRKSSPATARSSTRPRSPRTRR